MEHEQGQSNGRESDEDECQACEVGVILLPRSRICLNTVGSFDQEEVKA